MIVATRRAQPRSLPLVKALKVHRIAAPLRQQVVDNLRSAIADGRFVPGERLVERQLCELTGVSRTLVREALRQLETEGLIDVAPNRGPMVSVVGYDEAKEIYQIRQVLEPLACRLCAEAADDRLKRRLRAVFTDLSETYAEGDMAKLLRGKGAFYTVIFDGAGNNTLRHSIELMHVKINQLRTVSLAVPGRAGKSLRDIGEIVEAICASDPARAWSAAEAHVGRAAENALAVLRKEAAA
jgi:DNA-binding GntR family transcriptional regulator